MARGAKETVGPAEGHARRGLRNSSQARQVMRNFLSWVLERRAEGEGGESEEFPVDGVLDFACTQQIKPAKAWPVHEVPFLIERYG